jgi:hypothetical protein
LIYIIVGKVSWRIKRTGGQAQALPVAGKYEEQAKLVGDKKNDCPLTFFKKKGRA